MRAARAISLGAVFLAGLALAQDAVFHSDGRVYSAGPAKLVCGDCDQVIWSADGRDLAYSRHEGQSAEIGLFNLKRNRPGTVASLGADERLVQIAWLNAGHKALIVTRRPVADRQPPAETIAIRIADADRLESKELWASESPAGADVEIDVSPILEHAILTITAGTSRRMVVLTSNASSIVESTDLEAAAKEGQEIAGWSVDGTAIFAPDGGPMKLLAADNVVIKRANALSEAEIVSGQIVLRLNFANARPDIPVGATTLECVPANGVLRQVRFRGYWEDVSVPTPTLTPLMRSIELRLGDTMEQGKSLWLVSTAEKNPSNGLLVSEQAENAWLSPNGRAIAFTCHGALFVSPVTSKRAD